MSTATKWGLIGALMIVCLHVILHAINPVLLFGMWTYLEWPIFCIVLFLLGKNLMESGDVELVWRDLLRQLFAAFALASAIYFVYYYSLHLLIDPDLYQTQYAVMMEKAEQFQEALGGEQFMQSLEELEPEDLQVSLREILLGYGIKLIFPGFVFAAAISWWLLKNRPLPPE